MSETIEEYFKKPETVSNSEWNFYLGITLRAHVGQCFVGSDTYEKYKLIEAKVKQGKK